MTPVSFYLDNLARVTYILLSQSDLSLIKGRKVFG